MKTYSELKSLQTFIERYRYLKLGGKVGDETFGFDRWLNQLFYKDSEWLSVRDFVITRDECHDLATPGYDIGGRVLIHHINPICKLDILRRNKCLFDPENLVCTSKITHDAIHYGDESLLIVEPIIRTANDTCPWKR